MISICLPWDAALRRLVCCAIACEFLELCRGCERCSRWTLPVVDLVVCTWWSHLFKFWEFPERSEWELKFHRECCRSVYYSSRCRSLNDEQHYFDAPFVRLCYGNNGYIIGNVETSTPSHMVLGCFLHLKYRGWQRRLIRASPWTFGCPQEGHGYCLGCISLHRGSAHSYKPVILISFSSSLRDLHLLE
jgi:hypothetical protein